MVVGGARTCDGSHVGRECGGKLRDSQLGAALHLERCQQQLRVCGHLYWQTEMSSSDCSIQDKPAMVLINIV